MMNLLELVKARYSCRNYQPTGVEQEKLDYIMECVRLAPSACNKHALEIPGHQQRRGQEEAMPVLQ